LITCLNGGRYFIVSNRFGPVGIDQNAFELARDLAQRFNQAYSDTFKVPMHLSEMQAQIIMSLMELRKKCRNRTRIKNDIF
jgi:tryptophanyl-tRNA synthetase